ncbi:diacylglycerol/lipid kinase family protein [Microbacterium pumilum]
MHQSPPLLPKVSDGEGVLIVLNARSGTSVLRMDPRPVFAARLPRAVVHELAEGDDLADAVARHMVGASAPMVLGVYGGDGTVSRMAGVARHHVRPMLVLPGGTFNHFAGSLGLDGVDAAIDALETGSGREVTVVEASADGDDPLTVLTAVSVGTYPAFVEKREGREHLGKWLGGLVATFGELREARPIGIASGGRRTSAWSVFVGAGRNEPDLVAMVHRQTVDDGVLDVRVHHARGSKVQAMASLAFGRRTTAILRSLGLMPKGSDLERLVVPAFEFTVGPGPGRPSVFVHDGEIEQRDPAGFTLRCVAVPSALRVYAPAV